MNKLIDLLAERGHLIADGAMGTSLFQRGLQTGEAPDLWCVDNPEKVADVHQGFVDAGADIILTNSFGANAHRLKLHGDEHRVEEINMAAARVAREVETRAGRTVLVAGSMGPTGEIFAPIGTLSEKDAYQAFADQARALGKGGVDVLWIETISSKEEYAVAVRAAGETGLPVVATMTFDTNGRTMMGVTAEEAADFANTLSPSLVAYGANCGVGPATLIDTILGLRRAGGAEDIVVSKGNCGIPEFKDGALQYTGTPEIMADYARLARDAGARIIGGCCGTTAEHLAAIKSALDGYEPQTSPGRDEIEAALGAIDQAAPRASDTAPRPRRRRRN